jgi:hypothetical protein
VGAAKLGLEEDIAKVAKRSEELEEIFIITKDGSGYECG